MKTAKWDKPLSRRAYEKIKEKALIGVTIAGRELDFEEFEETIDIYIEKGKVVLPWCDHHDIYDIIFHMIKDDIDTAMRRSREARERAAARRRAKEEEKERMRKNAAEQQENECKNSSGSADLATLPDEKDCAAADGVPQPASPPRTEDSGGITGQRTP